MVVGRGFAQRHVVAHVARSGQVRNGGGIHLEGRDGAVLLFHLDVQLTAHRAVEILNGERPGGHGGFVQRAAFLRECDLGVALGDAAHFRRVALQVGRQHALVAGQVEAGEAIGVEHPGVEVDLAQRQLGGLHRQRAIGVDLVPVETGAAIAGLLIVIGLVVCAQAPGAHILPSVP